MFIRILPLLAGVLPVVGVTLAYRLGVQHAVLPSCLPFLDGCTSISATGRYLPGSLLFRAVMLPQSVLLLFTWYFSARWLRELVPQSRAATTMLVAGLVGALALVVYVTLLGTKTPFYEFMRRFGIYFYFLGTAVAQVALATTLWQYANRTARDSLRRIAAVMLLFCSLPFFLGVLNIVLKSVLPEAGLVENRIEWTAALLMQGYFVLLYRAWVVSRFAVTVTAR